MVAVFLRLKLRLLRNSLRGGGARVALTIIAVPLALMLAAVSFLLLSVMPRVLPLDEVADATAVFATLLAILWAVSPVYLFSSDNTLDPARMVLLPLSVRELMPGIAAAAWLGVPPIATLIALSGMVVGLGRNTAAVLAAAVGVVLAAALCVFTSRAVATASAAVLRSRRGRDLGTLLTILTAGLMGVLVAAVPGVLAQPGVYRAVAAACRWLPPGAAVHAGADAAAGRWWLVAADLLVAGAAVMAALYWWSRGLAKALVTPSQSVGAGRGRPASPLFPRGWSWLPRTRGGAVFARELRYAARSPYRRASIALGVVGGAFLGFSPVILGGASEVSVFVGCWMAAVYAVALGNPLGYEGRALWLHHAIPGPSYPDWRARILAALVVGAVPAMLASTVAAGLSGRWSLLPAAVGLTAVILAAECGVGAIFGVLLPYAMPDVDENPFSTGTGGGVRAMAALFVSTVAAAALGSPVIALTVAGQSGWAPGLPLVAVVGLGYAPLIVAGTSRLAGALHDRRAPEVLAVVAAHRG